MMPKVGDYIFLDNDWRKIRYIWESHYRIIYDTYDYSSHFHQYWHEFMPASVYNSPLYQSLL